MAPIALRAWPEQRRTRPTSIRRSRPAGSARGARRTRRFRSGHLRAKDTEAAYAKAAIHGEQIRGELAAKNPNLLVLDREFETQSVDPMFLEPESGLAWYNRKSDSLELVLGVQSPYEAADSIAHLLGNARAPFKPARIKTQFTYVGGGFGGRDHTPFVLYVALAAMFFPGRPVRLAHDRYQQFQGGIKRHAFKMRSRIGVDRSTGKIQAFAADHVLDGGGLANFSPNVRPSARPPRSASMTFRRST